MAVLDYQELLERLTVRRPLLMLDRALVVEPGRKVQALKAASMDEEFFQGHFPGAPILPGVLQVAAMSQAAELLLPPPPAPGLLPWLAAVQKIKFRKPVLPGDLLLVEATFEGRDEATGECLFSAQTRVEDEVACQGVIRLAWRPRAAFTRPLDALVPNRKDLALPAAAPRKVEEVMAVIPHRYPFLLIDRILHMDAGAQRLVGLKNISGNEPYMAAPALPFTPGYLQVEMAAQAGCALALSIPANHGKLGFFMAIDEARFHAPVLPGDQLLLDTASEMRAKFGKGEAKLYVGDQLVSEVLMKFAIVDREAPAGGAA